jgi:hypothetical protein
VAIVPARETVPARAIDLRKCQPAENGAIIHHIAAMHRTVIEELPIDLVRLTIVRDKAEIVRVQAIGHRNCRPAAIGRAPVREIVLRLVRLAEIDPVAAPGRVHRPDRLVEIE